jgi:hypothetical protein
VIHYEKLHDQWIRNISINRNRLLELFNRINSIEQSMINTKVFLQQVYSIKPNILILYNEINLFLKRRLEINFQKPLYLSFFRQQNDNDTNMNITEESKSSLNMNLYQTKKILHSNQSIVNQIQQKLSRVNQNHSALLNQISTVDKQRYPLIQHIESLHNKWFIQQQQASNILNKLNHIKHSVDLNNTNVQQFTLEKQKIIRFILKKQHLIVLINEYIELNNKKLNKRRLCYNELMNKIRQIRSEVLHEIQHTKPHQSDAKQIILHLRTELLEYKKKTNHFQHRICQRHLTRQILINSHDKSIVKGIKKIFFSPNDIA